MSTKDESSNTTRTKKETPKVTITKSTEQVEFVTRPMPMLTVTPETIPETAPFTGRSISIEPDGSFKAGRIIFNIGDSLLWNGAELRVFTPEEVKEKLIKVDSK